MKRISFAGDDMFIVGNEVYWVWVWVLHRDFRVTWLVYSFKFDQVYGIVNGFYSLGNLWLFYHRHSTLNAFNLRIMKK